MLVYCALACSDKPQTVAFLELLDTGTTHICWLAHFTRRCTRKLWKYKHKKIAGGCNGEQLKTLPYAAALELRISWSRDFDGAICPRSLTHCTMGHCANWVSLQKV